MAHQVGVLLSGCGVMDGAEIHETVLTLLALQQSGCDTVCIAPDHDQAHVVDHLTGEPVEGEKRGMLAESARIARGKIKSLADVSSDSLDALVLPGGFGAAKNLCDFDFKGHEMTVLPEVETLLQAMHAAGKPICALCIAPVVVAKALASASPEVTIGNEGGAAEVIESVGAKHILKNSAADVHIDAKNKIVTTPAYMLAKNLVELNASIASAIQAMVKMLE
ncbi:isoprenoid biosynthesis glyoxalase ElbB [Candidatus Sumerlaeota bacterium]|nr:isoprenoid biosynthesis glyoxalase ElbB [Candidatus Sumerlaeota bacterium]